MVTFFTLNMLIDDILLTIRNNNISESDDLSRIQIEQWIHYYRAMLIKQDVDKGREINPSYMQILDNMELEKVPVYAGIDPAAIKNKLQTVKDIPKPLDFHFGNGIVLVTDMYNHVIQHMVPMRSHWQSARKYSGCQFTYHYEPDKIFIEGCKVDCPETLKYIRVRGVFEDPTKAGYDADTPYPMPVNMIPTLKQLIMERELMVMLQMPSDDKNSDSLSGLKKPNAE